MMLAPTWAFNIIDPQMPYSSNCQEEDYENGYGTLTFVLDGIDYDIPSTHWMKHYSDVAAKNDSYCISAISAVDIQIQNQKNLFILGDVFMQIYYSIFDRDKNRIGLAKAKRDGEEMVYTYIQHEFN
jgi:hypothetical protein